MIEGVAFKWWVVVVRDVKVVDVGRGVDVMIVAVVVRRITPVIASRDTDSVNSSRSDMNVVRRRVLAVMACFGDGMASSLGHRRPMLLVSPAVCAHSNHTRAKAPRSLKTCRTSGITPILE